MEDWSRERDEASNVQGPFRDGSPLRDEVEPDDADDNDGEDEAELGPQRHSREVPERGLLPLFVIHGVSVVIRAWETQRVGPVGLEPEASPQTRAHSPLERRCAYTDRDHLKTTRARDDAVILAWDGAMGGPGRT